jgi:serine/threonine protein kinase
MEELPLGTLLEYQQKRMKLGLGLGKEELAIRLMELVYALHRAGILHGDIKPDNFMVVGQERDKNYKEVPIVKLIDFGRAIDLRSHPTNTVFMRPSKTDAFECYQMTQNQPWNYHIDLYGLAGTMYVFLFGKYMKVVEQYGVISIPERRVSPQWSTFFNKLLNFPTPTESKCPDLNDSPLPSLLKYFDEDYLL